MNCQISHRDMATSSWKCRNTIWKKEFTRSYRFADLIDQSRPFRQFLIWDDLDSQILRDHGDWPQRLYCGGLRRQQSDIFYFVAVRSGQSYFNSYVPTVSERKRTKRRQRLEVMVSSLRTTEGSAGWFKLSQCQVFYPMMVFWCLGHKGCGLLDK
jgi:hypothetical protein